MIVPPSLPALVVQANRIPRPQIFPFVHAVVCFLRVWLVTCKMDGRP
ncbi:MAG: hypothetical protein IPL28_20410 [Chloroflexi bacterium]|nr:hypothetical protein [Chloroflexota bacterium]